MACGGPPGGFPGGPGGSRCGCCGGLGWWLKTGGPLTFRLLTFLPLRPLHLPADDLLEAEDYVETEGAEPGEAADLGRSRNGLDRNHEGPLRAEGGDGPQLMAARLPEAEAMPAALSYEELVRRNVVGLGRGSGGWAWPDRRQQPPRSSCRSSSSAPLRSSCRRRS